MRPTFYQTAFACLSLALVSGRAETADPADVFLEAYRTFQKAEQLEGSGNAREALKTYQRAISLLDQITRQSPGWNPVIVTHRREKAAAAEARLKPVAGKGGPLGASNDDELVGNLPSRGSDAIIPGTESFVPPTKSRPKAGAETIVPPSTGSPLRDAQVFVENLQDELSKTKGKLENLTRENEALAKKYDQVVKDAEKSADKQLKLQKRADMLEDALMRAEQDGVHGAEVAKQLRAEMQQLKKQLDDVRFDRDAEMEVRQQVADSLASARNRLSTATQERDAARKENVEFPGKIAAMQKQIDQVLNEKGDVSMKLTKVQEQLTKVTAERDDAIQQVAKMKEAQKQVDKLLADNNDLMAKLSTAESQIKTFKAEGVEKDKQIAALKTEVTGVKKQLVDAQKQSATYQAQMSDLQGKLETQAKELTQIKSDVTISAADRKRLAEENEILRGIVVRQMKQQAVRDKTKQLVLTELAKLEVNSKALFEQIEFLGQPVVKLSEKEKRLFKQPTIEISDAEISIAAPKEIASKAPETPPTAATSEVADAKPAPAANDSTPPNAEATKPGDATGSKESEPKIAKTEKPGPSVPPEGDLPAKSEAAPIEPTPDKTTASTEKAAEGATNPVEENPGEESVSIPGNNPGKSPTQPVEKSAETASSAGVESGSPAVPPELLTQAQAAKEEFDKANYREAEKLYEKILQKAPNNLYILSNLGVVRFRSGKLKLAEESFKKAIALAPEDAFSRCTLGIVYYSQGKYDEAVNELTKALAINPKNATAHNYLGITASQKGWQEAAQKELETATSLDPKYADAHFNLAVVFATQQPPNKENARKHYKLATELGAEPDSALEQLIK